ncbi:MAG: nuclease domain-containing protein [Sarcina sp.]
MDIQCDKLFTVEFLSDFSFKLQEPQLKENLRFYKTIAEACNAKIFIEIKENKKTLIHFKSISNDAKLYMQGLEMLDYNLIEGSEGFENLYIKPSNQAITLSDVGNYPLIPGNYVVKVIIDTIEYFSMFKVAYKFLEKNEAENIKLELEKELNGLAFELIRRNLGLGNLYDTNEVPINLFKFLAIKDKFPIIMAALLDLSNKPNYKIAKYYKNVARDKVKVIDNIGVQKYLTSKVKTGYMNVPIKYFEYNLPENRYLKKILKYLTTELNEFIKILNNSIESKNRLIKQKEKYKNDIEVPRIKTSTIVHLNELRNSAIKIKNSINILKGKEWYSFVSSTIEYTLPHSMFQDARYNILYKLYRELKNESFNITLDTNYSVQMKKTDKLYEMWCYIKLNKILRDSLKFEVLGGWLFDQNLYKHQVIIPDLKANTRINLKKDNISINFIYDSELPRVKSKTNKNDMPLYSMRSSNRPDGRLDVYKGISYIGSIIFEFKYRDRTYLWTFNEKKDTNCISKQLLDYASGFKTREGYITNMEAVRDVIVLCPISSMSTHELEKEDDYYLTFINFKPDKNEELVAKELEKAINSLVENYESVKSGIIR